MERELLLTYICYVFFSVFDCCFSTNVMEKEAYKDYIGGIVADLQYLFPDASIMVFNFREGGTRSQISDVLAQFDMTVMEYPQQYEGCPLLPLEMVHHFLRSSESWLSVEGQQNVVLFHCERGGWPVLAFMLAGLQLYRKWYTAELRSLEMLYKLASKELLQLASPLNPQPSQLRYLQYVSRILGSEWSPQETPLLLYCLILRDLPLFGGGEGCRPIVRVYGPDPTRPANSSSNILFETPGSLIRHYPQAECTPVGIDIYCCVQGDVVLECIHLSEDLVHEEMMFRIMFHTAFVHSNILILRRDDIDVVWDSKEQFPKDFEAEVLFLDVYDLVHNLSPGNVSRDISDTESDSSDEFFEVEEIFTNTIDALEGRGEFGSPSDPLTSQDSTSDDGSHQQEVGMVESGINTVKDIVVDDVKYKFQGMTDSDPHEVRDIVVDEVEIKSNSTADNMDLQDEEVTIMQKNFDEGEEKHDLSMSHSAHKLHSSVNDPPLESTTT
ncbi:hypothetical protein Ahy_B08g089162 [Arachis hypogaea]|uniref:C2 tensin-type domain-containing protein n=1 Tax=Arachis hypogaea TaxID=3818 RepID=A0A444XXK9_ARAHY|nr:hypothetical protein Ahy_B08g089162 [Arachis hypogaea]